MTLETLIAGLYLRRSADSGALGAPVRGVTEDSRRAGDGFLFIARRGTALDGARFIDDAIARGAAAVLAEEGAPDRPGAVFLRSNAVARDGATIIERFHGEPSKRLALVGVTGTNGKTTVARLVRSVYESQGRRCGEIGTVCIYDGAEEARAAQTTPPAEETSAALARMVGVGLDACAMEVSSHALDQGRAAGLSFRVAVFTNITGDHLDYHGDFDRYLRAKSRLFEALPPDGAAVINADDPAGARIAGATAGRVVRCSMRASADAEWRVRILGASLSGTTLRVDGPVGAFEARSPLVGAHNAMNALQALAAAHAAGLAVANPVRAVETLTAPAGRLQPVDLPADEGGPAPFAVFVDYAHTDDALARALEAARSVLPEGASLRVVFGCGGDRDRTKRPRMGAAAARLADAVYVTSDNPRTEDPEAIIDEVIAGAPPEARSRVARDADRARAIDAAVRAANPGDAVLIAGKGHEDEQVLPDGGGGAGGTVRRPFDDRLVAREALRARFASGALA